MRFKLDPVTQRGTVLNGVLFRTRKHYTDGSAQVAFQKDLEFAHSPGIRGLPACLI